MAAHGLDNNITILHRWGAAAHNVFGSDQPLPTDFEEWAKSNQSLALRLQAFDAELSALLTNQAPSALKLAALTGSLADETPTAEELAEQQRVSQIEELLSQGNPWGQAGRYEEQNGEQIFVPPTQGNMTNAYILDSLDPALSAKLKQESQPAAVLPPGALTEEAAARINAQLAANQSARLAQPSPQF